MNPEIKALWVDKLRSGEYEQVEGRLRYTDPEGNKSYCCLGVLCDLYVAAGHEGEWSDGDFFETGDGAVGTYPPPIVARWAGMNNMERLGEFMGPKESKDVASMNDTGKTFAEIADVIERLG